MVKAPGPKTKRQRWATPSKRPVKKVSAGEKATGSFPGNAQDQPRYSKSNPGQLRLEWWEADRLAEHPENWRRHPPRQKQAVAQLLKEVGWAGALLYNERTGRLLDGHLRRQLARGQLVPVLVGSWSEEQERKILTLLDPVTGLANPDADRWQSLLQSLSELDAALAQALAEFAQNQHLPLPGEVMTQADCLRKEVQLPAQRFEVIVECPDEKTQRDLYERLTAEGFHCRVLAF